ncbi:hypothetical protein HanPI659440_Chr09g0319531 [Helianthus annuus]|nr:hypothetical protein HanPI659440_Chr09g0319531 [Helianthus annuus]
MKQFVDDLLDLTEVDDDLLKRSICAAHAKDVDDSLQMIHCLYGLRRLYLTGDGLVLSRVCSDLLWLLFWLASWPVVWVFAFVYLKDSEFLVMLDACLLGFFLSFKFSVPGRHANGGFLLVWHSYFLLYSI